MFYDFGEYSQWFYFPFFADSFFPASKLHPLLLIEELLCEHQHDSLFFQQEDSGGKSSSNTPKKATKTKSIKSIDVKKSEKVEPISKEVLDVFTEGLLPGCLQMLIDMPDAVHTIYDLIVAVANRNGDKWKGSILEAIGVEVFILRLIYVL